MGNWKQQGMMHFIGPRLTREKALLIIQEPLQTRAHMKIGGLACHHLHRHQWRMDHLTYGSRTKAS